MKKKVVTSISIDDFPIEIDDGFLSIVIDCYRFLSIVIDLLIAKLFFGDFDFYRFPSISDVNRY